MANKLYFKYNSDVMDAIPFLWDPDIKDEITDSQLVTSREDYQYFVREIMGGSNRCRSISIVSSLEAAKALAYHAEAHENAMSIITEVGDNLYAVGSTSFSGNYDDGLPLVTILTENEADCDLDPSISEMTSILASSENCQYEPEILILGAAEYEL